MNFKKQFKKLEKENKNLFNATQKHLIAWSVSRASLNNAIKSQKEDTKILIKFCRGCIDFNNFLRENSQEYIKCKIPYEPMLKQIKIDLNYCAIEKERRLKLEGIKNSIKRD